MCSSDLGPRRIPFTLFNEKVMAGLGASLAKTEAIEETAMQRALVALARFRHLCCDMEVEEVRCAATAAVRASSHGPEFIRRAEAVGVKIDLHSGPEAAQEPDCGGLS